MVFLACLACLVATLAAGKVVNVETDLGVKPSDDVLDSCIKNVQSLQKGLASLQPGDTLVVPNKTYHFLGNITAENLHSVTIQIDGTLDFVPLMKHWPRASNGRALDCIHMRNLTNVTFTSSGKGTLNGNGKTWWEFPYIGYLELQENRPKLFSIADSKSLLVENMLFLNSPYWNFWVTNVDGLEVRRSDISARRTRKDGHGLIDRSAFNTDGFDVTGKNVWIHDCNVWNQDDCIAVKDGSENMLFERINASGIGLTIGSIGGSVVRNITFRDCYMHKTWKGIYMKFREDGGHIEDILYERIVMDEPSQFPIWIGPAQQSDSSDLCAAHPCSLCWPTVPFTKCNAPEKGIFRNITLKDITINKPKMSPGVLIASKQNPMTNVVFDGVKVNDAPHHPWEKDYYHCENVIGKAIGGTSPVPPCMKESLHDEIVLV